MPVALTISVTGQRGYAPRATADPLSRVRCVQRRRRSGDENDLAELPAAGESLVGSRCFTQGERLAHRHAQAAARQKGQRVRPEGGDQGRLLVTAARPPVSYT